jgi:hypothetical protein
MNRICIVLTMAALHSASLLAQSAPWQAELARVMQHAHADFDRLPNYACQETVRRYEKPKNLSTYRPLDTIRFEVALFGDKELFAPAGAERFDEMDAAQFMHRGAVSTGTFSSTVRNLFVHENAHTTGRGQESINHRKALRYDFEIPAASSGYTVTDGTHRATVALNGHFWTDAGTLDLLRIEQHAVDIPGGVKIDEAVTTIDYGRVKIGDTQVLLARSSQVDVAAKTGRRERNVTEFSNCRAFGSESVIHFGEDPAPAPVKKQ